MPETILIIEDEPAIADNLVYALELDGFATVWCATGGDGMRVLRDRDIALVVLDVGLPDTNGFELCKKIRSLSAVPVIFLTARSDEVDRIVGLEIGGDDYVVKPFSPRELAARVRAVLRRTAASRPSPDKTPTGLEIDRARRQIMLRGTALDLSRSEFNILAELMVHPGWVRSREQLMDAAWDDPGASSGRTVDAHVKSLRAKLRKVCPGKEVIVTHRGVGYALSENL